MMIFKKVRLLLPLGLLLTVQQVVRPFSESTGVATHRSRRTLSFKRSGLGPSSSSSSSSSSWPLYLAQQHHDDKDAAVKADASKIEKSMRKPEEILSEEQCHNLFQFLLRDLQVEGVPLLAADADQVNTLQAALWTTMAELLATWKEQHDKDDPVERACLIFEEIPVDALRSFVDDFRILQTQDRLMEDLPELQPFHLSMVGKGVGPAILIEIGEKRDGSSKQMNDDTTSGTEEMLTSAASKSIEENRITAAMKMFVDRMMASDVGLQPALAQYRVCEFGDVCHVLSSFWNCICQLQVTSAKEISSIVLALPNVSYMKTTPGVEQEHDRFAAVAELVSRSLCLYRGDDVFELLHLHPTYKRQRIFPIDQPSFGHLPPSNWIRPILQSYSRSKGDVSDDGTAADDLVEISNDDLRAVNYLRRAPVTAVVIKRVALMDEQAATDEDAGETELELDDGVEVMASAIAYEAKSIMKVVKTGKEALKSSLIGEIEVADVQ